MKTRIVFLLLGLQLGFLPAMAQWIQRNTPAGYVYTRVHNRTRDTVVVAGWRGEGAWSVNAGQTWWRGNASNRTDSINCVEHMFNFRGIGLQYECNVTCEAMTNFFAITPTSSIATLGTGFTNRLEDTYFFPYLYTGFMVGDVAGVYRTTDGGQNWNLVPTPNLWALNKITFSPDNLTGYAVGDRSQMIKTIDGGLTWTRITNSAVVNGKLLGVQFPTPQIGYVSGEQGLWKTTNGGTSWVKLINESVRAIAFWTPNDGMAAFNGFGSYQGTYITNDGGQTWTVQPAVGISNVYDLSCDRRGYCYVMKGIRVYFYDNPNPVGLSDIWTSEVSIYPNPASAGQAIQYNLTEGQTYTLQIYSQTGVLVHQQETEGGTHLLPSSLSRGLYLLRFSAAGKSYQQRLIIE